MATRARVGVAKRRPSRGKRPGPSFVIGVDGGGTKTIAAVADERGRVLGIGRGGPANFQAIGRKAARREIEKTVDAALAMAGVSREAVDIGAFGLSGADREKDFDILAYDVLLPANLAKRFALCNDTTLVLRAGTPDGVGVACVSGTGSNTMGFNAKGGHWKVGGFGGFSGDYGSSYDIAMNGVVAAMKEWDGRGPKTLLTPLICEAFGLEEICDIIELGYYDSETPMPIMNKYAPLVFQAARQGDRVARRVLREAGALVGRDVLTCLSRLFPDKAAPVRLVLGGSVYQKGIDSTMRDALEATVHL